MNTIPVLIVGAGPTGLTMAIECCRHQIPFRLIEKLPEPAPYSKALAIWQGSLQVLQAQGLLSAFMGQALSFKTLQFLYRNKVLASLDPLEGLPEGAPRPLLLAQSETERLLAEHLQHLGGTLERGVELINVRPHKDHVVCELRNSDGTTEILKTSWLLACDGARSFARKYLEAVHEVKFKGYTEEDTFQLGDFEVSGDYANEQVKLMFDQDSTLAVFPVSKTTVRLIAKDQHAETPTLESFQALLHQHRFPLNIQNPSWLTTFRINERLSTHWVKERMILLGDAAHIHSPAGGQGMNMGIQDAFNLGWKLAHLLAHPRATEVLLTSYEDERYPVVKKVVTEAAQKLHLAMTNNKIITPIKRWAITLAGRFPILRKKIMLDLSELQVHYSGSELINDGHWPHYHDGIPAGHKLCDIHLLNSAHNEVSLFQTCVATSHVLLIFALDQTLDPQLFKDLPKAAKLVIIHTKFTEHLANYHFFDIDNKAHELYGASEPCWYLIRPDQFIAKRGYLKDIKPITDYFLLLFA